MESNDYKIYLTRKEFNKLYSKQIGQGTDGIVFKYNKDYLIKLYQTAFLTIPDETTLEDPTKIATKIKKPSFKPIHGKLRYHIKEEDTFIKLNDEDAFLRIKETQKKIVKTRLPEKLVYVDGRLVGVLLKKIHGIQIHRLIALPMKYKKIILNNLIDTVEELLNNNVYHVDIDNSPHIVTNMTTTTLKPIYGHSHVLVNPFTLKVNLIDLDGKSTIYTNYKKQDYINYSIMSLLMLIIEYLFEINPDEYNIKEASDEREIKHFYREIKSYGIDDELSTKLSENAIDNLDDVKKLIKQTHKKR